ncbi:acyl-CoA N-acyltransferase [Mycena galopus ATCC 62051]|nr:acyl-CoA N-acyltransferase [Mycena galopus ATCC 62051]
MSSEDIYIRRYRPSDQPQIRTLLFEGFVTSEGSPAFVAKRRYLFKPPSFIAYFFTGIGIGLLPRGSSSWRILGALLCAVGIGLFAAVQYSIPQAITAYCEEALKADMGNIEGHYRAPAAFFVAARVRGSNERAGGEGAEEVVGYVGLEYLPEKDPCTTEARRMIVSAKYRRRGIAQRLMRTLIAHAESIPKVQSIDLWLTEFQPGAQRLYERLGWKMIRTERVGNALRNATSRHFRLSLRKE